MSIVIRCDLGEIDCLNVVFVVAFRFSSRKSLVTV